MVGRKGVEHEENVCLASRFQITVRRTDYIYELPLKLLTDGAKFKELRKPSRNY